MDIPPPDFSADEWAAHARADTALKCVLATVPAPAADEGVPDSELSLVVSALEEATIAAVTAAAEAVAPLRVLVLYTAYRVTTGPCRQYDFELAKLMFAVRSGCLVNVQHVVLTTRKSDGGLFCRLSDEHVTMLYELVQQLPALKSFSIGEFVSFFGPPLMHLIATLARLQSLERLELGQNCTLIPDKRNVSAFLSVLATMKALRHLRLSNFDRTQPNCPAGLSAALSNLSGLASLDLNVPEADSWFLAGSVSSSNALARCASLLPRVLVGKAKMELEPEESNQSIAEVLTRFSGLQKLSVHSTTTYDTNARYPRRYTSTDASFATPPPAPAFGLV